MAKGRKGHYCKVCGEWKANEKFSGKGHASHICKSCMKLPVEKRNEMMTINRIMNLPWQLSRENRKWLEKMKADPREEVKEEAELAWEMRFPSRPHPEEMYDSDEPDLTDEELKELLDGEDEEIDLPQDIDDALPFS